MCRYLPCRFPFRFSNPRPSRPRWRRQGGEPEPMHTECRNAVEDGADGCFLLREEWGFPVILSEAERRMARKSDKQTTTGEKTDGRAVASLGPAGASAPFAASPPLREAVMVAGRTGGAGNRAKSEHSLRLARCLPDTRAIGRASCREECVSTCRSRWSPHP